MPAFTVNRGYPYSIPTDPADVPQALEDLARAVDTDVTNLEATIGVRPQARVRGVTPIVVDGLSTSADLTFELVDYNINGAIAPLSTNDTTVNPLLDGVWAMIGTLNYAQPGSVNIDSLGVEIFVGGVLVAQTITHRHPTIAQGTVKLDTVGIQFNNGLSDAIQMRAIVTRSAGTTPMTFRDRSLTLMRMTQS